MPKPSSYRLCEVCATCKYKELWEYQFDAIHESGLSCTRNFLIALESAQ